MNGLICAFYDDSGIITWLCQSTALQLTTEYIAPELTTSLKKSDCHGGTKRVIKELKNHLQSAFQDESNSGTFNAI